MEGLPFLGSPSNGIKGHKVGTKPQRSTNGKTVAERIAWMSRTSDVLGSFHNMTAESNTNLIRRKIQERCGNTQELMAAIRRLKTGDTGHVTPTEFRLTMIKFGISIPQSLCDTIFSLFDSDRSGTIDFDEFAMWIMNSEFRPVKKSEKLNDSETPEELLRKRLKLCLEQFPEVFATMKKRISFLDLSADIVRKEMPMTEKDARHLFKILDPNNSGLIDSIMLKRYAFDGITDPIPSSSSGPFNPKKSTSRPKPDLQESIFKICGHNTNLLLNCFRNYDQQNSQLQYDEFRSALLTQNLGVNPKDTQNLFLALDGAKGVCELSILFKTVKPTPLDPASVVSSKEKKPSYISQSRADRRLREAIRKVYKQLSQTLAACDKTNSGFLPPQLFCRVLNGIVIPINYEDFRFMMSSVHTDETGNYSYPHFLTLYDPNRQPHELSGVASVTSQAENIFNQSQPQSYSLSSSQSAPTLSNSSYSQSWKAEDTQQPHSSQGQQDGSSSNAAAAAAERALANELKKKWHQALRMCKAQDADKTGFVKKDIFVASLETHLSQSLSSEDIASLVSSYAAGEDVDYHTCFRSCLNDVMNTAAGSSSNNKSIFRIAPLTKPRDSGASHPWDFKYQGAPMRSSHLDDSTIPYWKRACADPRARPSTTLAPSGSGPLSSLDSGGSLSFGFSKTLPSSSGPLVDLTGYEPKVISACQKIASSPSFRQFRDELKRSQLINYKGCISVRNWSAIFANHGGSFTLTKSENGALSRVFRAKGIPDTLNCKEFLDVCMALL